MFSLRNMLNEAVAQVNPFDNGQTAATVAQRIAQQPRPAAAPPQPNVFERAWNQVNPFDNGRTWQQTAPVAPPQSVFHQLTHGVDQAVVQPAANTVMGDIIYPAVTEAAQLRGDQATAQIAQQQADQAQANSLPAMIVRPFFNLGKAAAYAPAAVAREVQNKPITDIQQQAFGTTNQGGIAKEILGNTVAAGLTVAAPGIGRAVGAVTDPLVNGIVDSATSPVLNAATRTAVDAATQAPVGSAFNVSSTLGNNPNASAKDLKTAAIQGAEMFGAFGGLHGAMDTAAAATPAIIRAAQDSQVPKIISQAKDAVASTANDIVTNKPFRNISDGELASAQKVRDAAQGYSNGMDLTNQDMQNYYNVMRKAGGTNQSDVAAVDNAIGARRTYDTHQAYRQAADTSSGYIRIPGSSPENTAALNELARSSATPQDFASKAGAAHLDISGINPVDFHQNVQKEVGLENAIKQANPNLSVKPSDTPEVKNITLMNAKQQASKAVQDTGEKMFGSKKDMSKLRTIGRDNLQYIESQGERAANNLVTKQRVLGDNAKYEVNRSGDPHLEQVKHTLISSIPTRPSASPAARAMFVNDIPKFVENVKNAKTVQEAQAAADAFRGKVPDTYVTGDGRVMNGTKTDYERLRAVKQNLGSKFYNVVSGNSAAIRTALYRPATDFSFADKKAVATRTTEGQPSLHGGEMVPYERTGEKLPSLSPTQIRDKYNFKGLEVGNYVKDTEAKDHLSRFQAAAHDVGQTMNVNMPELIKKMDLGIGFGSRGGSKALAHYEPANKVINITKKTGADGTLGHEFAHALDDFLGNGKPGRGNYASDGKAANPEVRDAMRQVMKSITEGNSKVPMTIKEGANLDVSPALKHGWRQIDSLLERNHNDPQAAVDAIIKEYPGTHGTILQRVVNYVLGKTGAKSVDVPVKQSAFASAAEHQGDYWHRPTEMFARAFESYLREKSQGQGIRNNYMAPTEPRYGGHVLFTPDNMHEVTPAMDHLVATIKKEYGISDYKAPEAPKTQPITDPLTPKQRAQMNAMSVQPKYITEFEHATKTGDHATMQRIAAEHPNDNRVHIGVTEAKPSADINALNTQRNSILEARRTLDQKLSTEYNAKAKNLSPAAAEKLKAQYQARFSKEAPSTDALDKQIKDFQMNEVADKKTQTTVTRLVNESHSQNTYDPKSTGYFIDLSPKNIKDVAPLKGINDYPKQSGEHNIYVNTKSGISSVRVEPWNDGEWRVSNGNGNEIARLPSEQAAVDFGKKALTIENEAARQGKRVILSGSKFDNTAEAPKTISEKGKNVPTTETAATYDRVPHSDGTVDYVPKSSAPKKSLLNDESGALRPFAEIPKPESKPAPIADTSKAADKLIAQDKAVIAKADKAIADNKKITAQVEGKAPIEKAVTPKAKAPATSKVPDELKPFYKPKDVTNKTPRVPAKDVRGTIKTVRRPENDNVSPETKALLKKNPGSPIDRQPQAPLREAALKEINKSLPKATEQAMKDLQQKVGTMTTEQQMRVIKVAQALDAKGQHETASDLYRQLAPHRTVQAQGLAVGQELSRRNPDGIRYAAQTTLEKAGVKFEGKVADTVNSYMKDIKSSKPGTETRDIATQKLVDYVNNKIPRSKMDAVVGYWRAGLLTGLETVAKIASSHLITAPMELIDKPFAAAADQAVAGLPKSWVDFLNRNNKNVPNLTRRTVTLAPTDYLKYMKGNYEGLKAAGYHLKTGVDLPHTGGFEKELGKGQHQSAYERMVYRVHGSIYKTFYRGAYRMEEANQVRIARAMFGDNAKKVAEYMNSDYAQKQMENYASQFAMQNLTEAGKVTQGIQHIKIGKMPVGMWIAPFSRIPAAMGVKGIIDYTPVGTLRAARTLYDGLAHGTFDQRKFVDAIGKSAIGGTAIVGTGMLLSHSGRLTLQEPTDPKEKALWQAEGKTKNSIKVGNTWVSLNAMGAFGIALGIGGALDQALSSGQNGKNAAITAVASGAKLLADQPYMKGISGVANTLNNPKQYATSFVNSTAGSFVPAMIQQIARGTDNAARAYPKTLGDQLRSTIPGLREGLPAQRNIFGQVEGGQKAENNGNPITGTINPFYPNKQINGNDAVTNELQRLYNQLGSKSPAIAPTTNFKVGKQTISLNVKQQQDMLAATGQGIHTDLQTLMSNPNYQAMSDNQKTSAINSIINAHQNAYVDANFKTGNALTGGQKQQLQQGKSTMSLTAKNTGVDPAAVDLFKASNDKVKQIGNQTYYKLPDGTVKHQSTVLYNDGLSYAKQSLAMTTAKSSGDYATWVSNAMQQYRTLQDQIKNHDPQTEQTTIDALQKKADTLATQIKKYTGYGGSFTKPKSASTRISKAITPYTYAAKFKTTNDNLKSLLAKAQINSPKISPTSFKAKQVVKIR